MNENVACVGIVFKLSSSKGRTDHLVNTTQYQLIIVVSKSEEMIQKNAL